MKSLVKFLNPFTSGALTHEDNLQSPLQPNRDICELGLLQYTSLQKQDGICQNKHEYYLNICKCSLKYYKHKKH